MGITTIFFCLSDGDFIPLTHNPYLGSIVPVTFLVPVVIELHWRDGFPRFNLRIIFNIQQT